MAVGLSRHTTQAERVKFPSSDDSLTVVGSPNMALVGTDDAETLDDLLRLCAAAGVEPDVATTLPALQARWRRHDLVVLGADFAGRLAQGFVPRRGGVVVTARAGQEDIWTVAAQVGAEQVVQLPAAETWLVDRLSGLSMSGRPAAPVLAVLGAAGGVGASSLVAAIAQSAVADGSSVTVVDLDPNGSGCELYLGAQEAPAGLVWSDLAKSRGRLRGEMLRAALPQVQGCAVLGWGTHSPSMPEPQVVGSAIDSVTYACDLVVVDLPRSLGPAAAAVLCRAACVALVVPRSSVGVGAASRLLERSELVDCAPTLVITELGSAGVPLTEIEDYLELPAQVRIPSDPQLAKQLELGRSLAQRRSPLRKPVRELTALSRAAQTQAGTQ